MTTTTRIPKLKAHCEAYGASPSSIDFDKLDAWGFYSILYRNKCIGNRTSGFGVIG